MHANKCVMIAPIVIFVEGAKELACWVVVDTAEETLPGKDGIVVGGTVASVGEGGIVVGDRV